MERMNERTNEGKARSMVSLIRGNSEFAVFTSFSERKNKRRDEIGRASRQTKSDLETWVSDVFRCGVLAHGAPGQCPSSILRRFVPRDAGSGLESWAERVTVMIWW